MYVTSLFGKDYGMGGDDLALETLVAPPIIEEAPEPEPEKQPEKQKDPNVDIRKEIIATMDEPPPAINRRARWSGQRLFVSGVESVPSVMESPSATTAPACTGAVTSTADRKNHDWVGADTGNSTAPTWLPAVET
jgi:hypothetical protein